MRTPFSTIKMSFPDSSEIHDRVTPINAESFHPFAVAFIVSPDIPR
jgi:hypothetical protein